MRQIQPLITPPSRPLEPYVRNYWFVTADKVERTGIMRADGDVGFEVEAQFDDARRRYRITKLAADREQSAGGIRSARIVILPPGSGMAGVRFVPGGFFRLFGSRMHDTLPSLRQPLMQILSRPGPASIVELVGAFEAILLGRLPQVGGLHPAIDQALVKVLAAPAVASVDTLLTSLPLGRRHFERLFRQQVGLSPACFVRLQRINVARRLLGGTANPLSTVAYDCGFFDQAHLGREFSRAVGAPPGAYRRRKVGSGAQAALAPPAQGRPYMRGSHGAGP